MSRPCAACGASLAGRRRDAQYCGARCRQRAHRRELAGEPDFDSDLCKLVRKTYGHLDSWLVDALLICSAHFSNPAISARVLVALSKEMREIIRQLNEMAANSLKDDPLDARRSTDARPDEISRPNLTAWFEA